MRRVIAEIPREDFERSGRLPELDFVERLRVVHLFRFSPKSYAGVCGVGFRIPSARPSHMVGHSGMTRVVTLARLDDGTFLVYFEGRPTAGWARLSAIAHGHLNPTLEVSPDSWRISVVGTSAKLRSFLAELRRRHIHHHLLSIKGVDNPEGSPLEWLTPRQREVLVAAYRGGYYDTPRRASSARVARQLNLGKSATVEHLRKGQKRLLDGILRG
jgi:HTH DNA binding domain